MEHFFPHVTDECDVWVGFSECLLGFKSHFFFKYHQRFPYVGREDYWIFCCYLFCFLISVEDVCIPFPSCVMSHSDRRPCCTLCQCFRSSRFFCFLITFLKWHLFAFHYMRVCELESHDQACGGQRPTCVSCSLLPSRIACDWRQTPGLAASASTLWAITWAPVPTLLGSYICVH